MSFTQGKTKRERLPVPQRRRPSAVQMSNFRWPSPSELAWPPVSCPESEGSSGARRRAATKEPPQTGPGVGTLHRRRKGAKHPRGKCHPRRYLGQACLDFLAEGLQPLRGPGEGGGELTFSPHRGSSFSLPLLGNRCPPAPPWHYLPSQVNRVWAPPSPGPRDARAAWKDTLLRKAGWPSRGWDAGGGERATPPTATAGTRFRSLLALGPVDPRWLSRQRERSAYLAVRERFRKELCACSAARGKFI